MSPNTEIETERRPDGSIKRVTSKEYREAVAKLPPTAFYAMNDLPIHFFTIVVDGRPFIEWHYQQLKQLPFPWTWHVVEGLAELKHDTSWSLKNGGSLPFRPPSAGPSADGTTQYLDRLRRSDPEFRVKVYRKCCGRKWDGKIEMVREPLKHITEPCLLFEIDADEIWTAKQLTTVRELFSENPGASAAKYRCHYFVGPDLVVVNRGVYGNYEYEWLRTWRYEPGDRWEKHEPPILWKRNNTAESLGYDKTVAEDLVFQHFAYATEQQLCFKEKYYGYKGALAGWRRLQAHKEFPCRLAEFFPWVKDDAIVDRAGVVGITPLIKCYTRKPYQRSGQETMRRESSNSSKAKTTGSLLTSAASMDLTGATPALSGKGVGAESWLTLTREALRRSRRTTDPIRNACGCSMPPSG